MKKILCLCSSFALLLALPCAGESTNRLHFPAAGFSIAPLDIPPGESPQQALAMYLPTSDGFAAYVNVQIQPYTGTIEGYIALTSKQFKSAGIKVLQEKTLTKSVALFEYTGKVEGRPLHWYARAEKSGDAVYLVTATATPQQWSKESARLKSCVDGFRCEDGEPSPAPNAAGSRH
jgi:hypothetical protein